MNKKPVKDNSTWTLEEKSLEYVRAKNDEYCSECKNKIPFMMTYYKYRNEELCFTRNLCKTCSKRLAEEWMRCDIPVAWFNNGARA